MVKGVSKQAVIVPSPDPAKFEQAIFIVSGDSPSSIRSADEMLDIACRLASRYNVSTAPVKGKLHKALIPLLSFLLGSGATAAAFLLLTSL